MGRPHPALLDLAAGRPLPPVEDAPDLTLSALEHRMGGLLLSRARAGEVDGSGPWLAHLARRDLAVRAHQRRLWQVLDQLVARLGDAGFEIATVKGVTAQARWYDRAGERPCVDLDLLVAPGDVGRIDDIVRLIQPRHSLLPDVRRLVGEGYLSWVDIEVRPGLWVDLHTDVFKLGVPSLGRQEIWDRASPFPLPGGGTVRVLDPEVALVHFLLHLTRDGFSYLLGLADIHRVLERETIDWGFVERFVRREGLETCVSLALETVVGALRLTPVPYSAGRNGWRPRVWRMLWPAGAALDGGHGAARLRRRHYFGLCFLARGREREVFRWWLGRVVPPAALVDHRYGPGRSPYLWRLLRGRLERALTGRLRPGRPHR